VFLTILVCTATGNPKGLFQKGGATPIIDQNAGKVSLISKIFNGLKRRKIMNKKWFLLIALFLSASLLLVACGGAAPTAAPPAEEPAVEEEAAVEEPAAEEPAEEEAAVEEPAAEEEAMEEEATAEEPAVEGAADPNSLPRDETLYFNGQQWGSVVGWNPYSNSNNNAMVIARNDDLHSADYRVL
jgi:peptide/nickel transport system substrate-binding protein